MDLRGPMGRASVTAVGGPWQPGPYLGVSRHHKLGGQADVWHPAFRGKGDWVGQGVLHLDGGWCGLPDGAHHLDGFEDSWRDDPETHCVVQELVGRLVSEGHLSSQGEWKEAGQRRGVSRGSFSLWAMPGYMRHGYQAYTGRPCLSESLPASLPL